MREVAYATLSDRIGGHERMNLTLKKRSDTSAPLQQPAAQDRFDVSVGEFNTVQYRDAARDARHEVSHRIQHEHHAAAAGWIEPAYPFHNRDQSSQHAIASVGTQAKYQSLYPC
ncbi:hypothetical protein CQ12_32220 [Bradyrhizobium jicamae]|uniref:Uncharacterized protein n=1 Tax=Bradyrhizobium jicamae TaxID=280332 RepID=A0A0R3M5J3_9BRAD|nr:hypothetical protein [Bradyrhizobium jicamae]KRR14910.1 hypothetical protein CQ12_32220 [Bradyrhizobium jicamae]